MKREREGERDRKIEGERVACTCKQKVLACSKRFAQVASVCVL
jgi:hypothetical protein